MVLVAVAVGGAAGSCLRYLAGAWFLRMYPEFPWGTVLVNVAGSLVIGMLFPFLSAMEEHLRHLLVAGFLGGLTTMSGFSMETVTMISGGRYAAALANWATGAVLCLVFFWIGMMTTRQLA
jgi:fluoride exporter